MGIFNFTYLAFTGLVFSRLVGIHFVGIYPAIAPSILKRYNHKHLLSAGQ